ncbi:MAG: hypothetical protein KDD02_03580 [Phaeodactylibacter sp.]|nr:hypothetical protein [Phaeodactylibacter sp.]MCB9302555.1 hypothetical protein [Lewinellaceae bacterium]
MKVFLTLILGTTLFVSSLMAQDDVQTIFVLGENEKAYEMLNQSYSQTLLEVSDFDTQKAFDAWMDMMKQMEEYAKKLRFDIKGVKLWLHVFWNEDGTISHIGYLMRPDSRNIDNLELAAFLKTFMGRYKLPLSSSRKFSHYTGANFPIYSEKVNN